MKLVIVVLLILGVTYALPTVNYNLHDDFNKLMALIPMEEIHQIAKKHEHDPDVQEAIRYVTSEQFIRVLELMMKSDDVNEVVDFAELRGLRIRAAYNKLAAKIPNWPHWSNTYHALIGRTTRSIADMMQEIISIMPTDKLMEWSLDTMANSKDAIELYTKICSKDGNRIHDQAMSNPDVQGFVQHLNAIGVNTKQIWKGAKTLCDW